MEICSAAIPEYKEDILENIDFVVTWGDGNDSDWQRDRNGRFLPGTSGNLAGRPKGSTCHALRMAREAAEEVALPALIEAAKGGDMEACKVLVSYGLPRQKPVMLPSPVELPETGDLAEMAKGIFRMLKEGQIGVDVAGDLVSMLGTAARVEEVTELREQVENLKRLLNARRKRA